MTSKINEPMRPKRTKIGIRLTEIKVRKGRHLREARSHFFQPVRVCPERLDALAQSTRTPALKGIVRVRHHELAVEHAALVVEHCLVRTTIAQWVRAGDYLTVPVEAKTAEGVRPLRDGDRLQVLEQLRKVRSQLCLGLERGFFEDLKAVHSYVGGQIKVNMSLCQQTW
jgi:hypothetical protein